MLLLRELLAIADQWLQSLLMPVSAVEEINAGLVRDLGAQQVQELRNPRGVRWPGRGADQVAFGMGLIHRDVGIGAAS